MDRDSLTVVEEYDDYTLYTDENGDEVYLRDDSDEPLTEFDLLDLEGEWSMLASSPDVFLAYLRTKVIDPERVDDLSFCDDCGDPRDTVFDSLNMTKHGDMVCGNCLRADYTACDDCEEWERDGSVFSVYYDKTVCQRCYEFNYSYCDHCDEDYHHDEMHSHSFGCNCESPAQTFKVRNNGDGMLANDTETHVALPAGVISDEGLGAIARLLRNHAQTLTPEGLPIWHIAVPKETRQIRHHWTTLSYDLMEIGPEWQTKKGNFTKRLSRHAYQKYGLRVPPEIISEVGNIARAHSNGVDFKVEVTRNLNLDPSDFVHEDSCWWSDYYESRCALKTNGGFGLRSFNVTPGYGGGEYRYPNGRAWVMPLRRTDTGSLTPTFNTEDPDAFVVFNGYGDLDGYTPARIVAHMAGMTYRKIALRSDPMYVNSDSGYLVAPEEIADEYTDGSLRFSLSQHADLHDREQQDAATCNHFEPCSHQELATV